MPELTLDRTPPPDWLELARERGLFYHHPAWIETLGACFRFRLWYIASRVDGALIGGLPLAEVPALLGPRRLVSLPFSYAAGPMALDQPTALSLIEAARRLAAERGVARVEVKHVSPAAGTAPGYERVTHYSTYRVSTSGGVDNVWRRLNTSSTQRGIRKSGRARVRVVTGSAREDWMAMAELEERTAHRHGLPAPPRRFFLEACASLQARGLADLYLAKLPDSTTAGGVVVWKGWREWIYAFGASRPDLLEHRPNHALLWHALQRASDAGVIFDLGRAAPEQSGLVQFKERWGGVATPLAYDYSPAAAGLNVARRDAGALAIGARLWAKAPARLARAGAVLYRYLG